MLKVSFPFHTALSFLFVVVFLLAAVQSGEALTQGSVRKKTIANEHLMFSTATSEPLAMLWTLSQLGGSPGRCRYLGAYLNAQCSDAERISSKIAGAEYEKLIQSKHEFDLQTMILSAAANSTDLNDFMSSCETFLTEDESARLKAVVLIFNPIYNRIFWKKFEAALNEQRLSLDVSMKAFDMEDRLRDAANFYGNDWAKSTPFRVALVPLPPRPQSEYQSFRQCLGSVQIVEAWIDSTNRRLPKQALPTEPDFVFHEFCHALYLTSPQQKSNIKLTLNLPPFGKQNKLSYAQERGAKKLAHYEECENDGFASISYPKVSDYISQRKRIDDRFLVRISRGIL